MRHVIDVFSGDSEYGVQVERKTHLMIWESVNENVEAVLKYADAHGGAIGAVALANAAGGWSDGFDGNSPATWLGRSDLISWGDVDEAVKSPWQRGLDAVEGMLEDIAQVELPVPRSIKRCLAWDESSGDFDLDQYMSGKPFWRGANRRNMSGQQFITLVASVGGNRKTKPTSLLWRGAAACAMAKILEDQGYSVEILAYDYGVDTLIGRDLVQAVWIKRAEDVLDLSALVNAVSAWYFRLVSFASYYLVPGQCPTYGFGRAQDAPARLLDLVVPDSEFWRIEDVFSRTSAVALVVKFLGTLSQEIVDV